MKRSLKKIAGFEGGYRRIGHSTQFVFVLSLKSRVSFSASGQPVVTGAVSSPPPRVHA